MLLHTTLLLLLGATPTLSGPAAAASPAAARITIDQARVIALKAVPGKVIEQELERERGRWVYCFEIRAASGVKEVLIDAGNGALVAIEVEDEDEDDGDKNDKNDKD